MSRTGGASTTGIGSLPHSDTNAALELSFALGIPFLPQLPLRNPSELMIPEALENLTQDALETDRDLAQFEPSSHASSCWEPFIKEIKNRRTPRAKLQIAGPVITSQSMGAPLRLSIHRLIMARSLALCRRVKEAGARPLIFLDEPHLDQLESEDLSALRLLISTLREEGNEVGLHCCGHAPWAALLELPLDYLSLDTGLAQENLLKEQVNLRALKKFCARGGRLSLGVIPTNLPASDAIEIDSLFEKMRMTLWTHLESEPLLMHQILQESLYTPACGLAYHSVARAESLLRDLMAFEEKVKTHVALH